ncbi:DNA-processing protein DprA [Aquabacterium sp.]|uniref:DNA-processing protein DprA n=1 Tax=Aquabacterium sp. TaxID=1872578 RepID=UPI0024897B52|nr:DNA-processing protein DprA [Aquabacterium sp.]MDI1260030.1 DNA-processing protein DprA [Aquabacterium sp.]
MERDEIGAWLRLLLTPRVGPTCARRLLAALGSPQAVFTATKDTLLGVVSGREATELLKVPADWAEQFDATLAWLDAASPGQNRALITLGDQRYPAALLETADPPLLLFAQGRVELLQTPCVAIVGSRNPTAQGKENAFAFAQALSQAGITVVSGLALGVDGAAHEGALAGGRLGSTVAVVGTGLDRVYPKTHRDLAHRIAQDGLIISEFALGTPPLAANFPKRNRIVAGLSRGTLVVEAAVQSGSLITARLAMEMGREVLAIPGSIHSPQAKGCHALIKQGAKLVETAQDVLEEMNWRVAGLAAVDEGGEQADGPASDEDLVLDAMGYDPVGQEALSARTGMGPADLGARLLELEMMGQVARLPGALFQRVGLG